MQWGGIRNRRPNGQAGTRAPTEPIALAVPAGSEESGSRFRCGGITMDSGRQAGSALRLAGIVCAVMALVACRDTADDVIAGHRPAVEAAFGRLEALDAAVRNAPPITEDRIDVGSARVRLDGEQSNALYVSAEHLLTQGGSNLDFTGYMYSVPTQQCGAALRSGGRLFLVSQLRNLLPACSRAEYVFVQRTIVDVPAQRVDAHTFQPGRYAGDVLLFRLADGVLLGGFNVSGKSSDNVMVVADENGAGSDPIGGINRDLSASVDADISAKLKRHVPGVIP
ncbi:MAG: hypothetical protein ACREO3_09640 [Arenimonas sp.]